MQRRCGSRIGALDAALWQLLLGIDLTSVSSAFSWHVEPWLPHGF